MLTLLEFKNDEETGVITADYLDKVTGMKVRYLAAGVAQPRIEVVSEETGPDALSMPINASYALYSEEEADRPAVAFLFTRLAALAVAGRRDGLF